MRTRHTRDLILTLVLAVASAVAFVALAGQPVLAVSGHELVEKPGTWDRQRVTYRGEVIGDVMRRGRQAVVNVSDGTYAMGVWLPVRTAKEITLAGRHGTVGDMVEVHGTFYRACPEHGGDMDIHAEKLVILAPGRYQREGFNERRAFLALGLLFLALSLMAWERRRRQADKSEPQF